MGLTNNKDSNRSVNYAYDGLNRIASAATPNTDCSLVTGTSLTKNWGESTTIDAWGNLSARTVTKCSADGLSVGIQPNNQLTSFGYDASGNMTSNGGANYTYNGESQLATAGGATYTYDGDGNRVKKSSGTLYWGSGPLVESDLNGTASSLKEYIMAGGRRIARRDNVGTGNIFFYLSDNLGSSREIVASGASSACYDADFYPYGGERAYANTCPQNYKFTGKERDSESILDYFIARHYGSSLGRFMQPDDDSGQEPSDAQSWNLYDYVENGPLNRVDPSGRDCIYTSHQTSEHVTVTVQQGACSHRNGTYISGKVDERSLRYNGKTGELGYTFKDSSGEKGGVGVIALGVAPKGQLSSGQQWILGQAGSMGTAAVKEGALFMGNMALGEGLGRLAAVGIDAYRAGQAAKAAEEAVDIENLSSKIVRQMDERGWTQQEILDTVREGDPYPATNKATGGPATEYVSRSTGKFVVIDNETGRVIQISKDGFKPNHWEP